MERILNIILGVMLMIGSLSLGPFAIIAAPMVFIIMIIGLF